MYDLLVFAEARLSEDKHFADGLQFACRIPEKLPDFRACGGPAAEVYWERFTPGRMLAEADAKRAVLAEHLPVESMYGLVCKRCVSWQTPPWADGGETEFGIAISDPWPCLPVRGAVASWERHPDFRPEWAVTA
jgi:hypothetical protein